MSPQAKKVYAYPLLSSISDTRTFKCGVSEIDDFLHSHAYQSDNEYHSQTKVWSVENKAIGFYTSAVKTLTLEDSDISHFTAEKLVTHDELSKMDQSDSISFPVIDLMYFAVDNEYQGKGIGSAMMRGFLQDVAEIYLHHSLGFAGIVLVSLPNAESFYIHAGFELIHGVDYENGPMLKHYPMFLSTKKLLDAFKEH